MANSISIRPAVAADLGATNAIYNYYILNSTCVYQTQPWSASKRTAWFEEHDADTPIIVAERDGIIVGWGALSRFRAFYRTVEDSVYVHKDHLREGIGRALLAELLRIGEARELNAVIAIISADQEASIALHRKFGFTEVGLFPKVGYKFGKWLDCVFLHYRFGEGSTTAWDSITQ
jgi:L-amino acid N-acyltransferase